MSTCETSQPGARADPNRPSIPRIYSYLTGGHGWFPADRDHAETLLGLGACMKPDFRELATRNRHFILAVTRWAASRGIGQFLDLGSGLPASPAVHDMAPEAVVAYVDNDRVAALKMRAWYQGNPRIAVSGQDVREPEKVLGGPAVSKLLDMGEPLCALLGGTLSAMSGDDARQAVAGYAEAMTPGSALVISCVSFADPATGDKMAAALSLDALWVNHSAEDVASFFEAGKLEVQGGLADLRRWPRLLPVAARGVRLTGGVALKKA